MSNETLGLLFRATGDFSDVTQSATRSAQEIQRQFGPQSPLGKLGGEQTGLFQRIMGGKAARTQSDSNRILNSVREAIERTHQSGKRLRDLNLGGQFGEAAKHALAIQRSMDGAANTLGGRDLKRRVKASDQDWDRPHEWDWNRFGFGSAAATRRAQARFFGTSDGESSDDPPGSSDKAHGKSGAAGRMGAWGMRQGRAALGAVAGLAGVAALGSGFLTASREDFRRVENINPAHKGLAGTSPFGEVKQAAVDLAEKLNLLGSEAAALTSSFIRASGATDIKAVERVEGAIQFGKGFGLKPDVTTELFGQAEKVGYGTSKQGQREFATLLAQTIGGSGMFAKADQVMGDFVEHIGNIASTQGRTASTDEMGVFGNFMEQLYSNKALRGGGAQNILGELGRVGSGDSMVDMNFAWNAFGDVANGDIVDTMRMAKGDFFQSMDAMHPGRGLSKTPRGLLAFNAINDIYAKDGPADPNAPDKDRQNYIWASGQLLGMDANKAGMIYDFGTTITSAGNPGDYAEWASRETGKNPEDIAMEGHMRLAKLWVDKDKSLAERKDTLLAMAKEFKEGSNKDKMSAPLKDKLTETMAMDSGEQQWRELSTLLPKIIAEIGGTGDEHEKMLDSQAKITNALGDLGKEINDLVAILKEPIAGALKIIAAALSKIVGGVEAVIDTGAEVGRPIGEWWFNRFGNNIDPTAPTPIPSRSGAPTPITPPVRAPIPTPSPTGDGSGGTPQQSPVDSFGSSPVSRFLGRMMGWGETPRQSLPRGSRATSGVSSALGGALGFVVGSANASEISDGGERTGVHDVLDTIASTESGPDRNLNAVEGDPLQGTRPGDVDFTQMKVREVVAWQRDHGNKRVGRYGFDPDKLESEAKIAGPEFMDAPFNEGVQGYFAEQLARRHGMQQWLGGEGTSDDLLNRLSPVWPGVNGADGNTNFSRPRAIEKLDRARPQTTRRRRTNRISDGDGNYPFKDAIAEEAKKRGIPAWALAGVIAQESNFDPKRVGDHGKSWGLGQLNESTGAKDFGLSKEDVLGMSGEEQLPYIAEHLRRNIKKAGGNVWGGIRNYNGGGDDNYVSHVRERMQEYGIRDNDDAPPRRAPIDRDGPRSALRAPYDLNQNKSSNLSVRKGVDLNGVDPSLLRGAVLSAQANPDLGVEIISGVANRSAGTSNHSSGHAIDVALRNLKTGEAYQGLGNRSGFNAVDARVYEKFWQDALAAGSVYDPSLAERMRFGGYFVGGPNPMDGMHADTTPGAPKTAGGDLVNGATPAWQEKWGYFSQPMKGRSIKAHQDDLRKRFPNLFDGHDSAVAKVPMPKAPIDQEGPRDALLAPPEGDGVKKNQRPFEGLDFPVAKAALPEMPAPPEGKDEPKPQAPFEGLDFPVAKSALPEMPAPPEGKDETKPQAPFEGLDFPVTEAALPEMPAPPEGKDETKPQAPLKGLDFPMAKAALPEMPAPLKGEDEPKSQAPFEGLNFPVAKSALPEMPAPLKGEDEPKSQAPFEGLNFPVAKSALPEMPAPLKGEDEPKPQAPFEGLDFPMAKAALPEMPAPLKGEDEPKPQAPFEGLDFPMAKAALPEMPVALKGEDEPKPQAPFEGLDFPMAKAALPEMPVALKGEDETKPQAPFEGLDFPMAKAALPEMPVALKGEDEPKPQAPFEGLDFPMAKAALPEMPVALKGEDETKPQDTLRAPPDQDQAATKPALPPMPVALKGEDETKPQDALRMPPDQDQASTKPALPPMPVALKGEDETKPQDTLRAPPDQDQAATKPALPPMPVALKGEDETKPQDTLRAPPGQDQASNQAGPAPDARRPER